MRIVFKKNKITLIRTEPNISPFIFIPILLISIILSIKWPLYLELILLISTSTVAGISIRLKQKFGKHTIEITAKGVKLWNDHNTEYLDIQDVKLLYIKERNGMIEIFINDKNNALFNFYSNKKINQFIERTRFLLRLKKEYSKKTSVGSIHKLISMEAIEERKNHHNISTILNIENKKSKSDYFNLEMKKNELSVMNINRIGEFNLNKLVVDKESHSVKIHRSKVIPDELSIYDIKEIRHKVNQNSTGEAFDLIVGELIAITIYDTEVIIFHCELIEQNPLNFTSEELNKDLIALKAIINFEILSIIDKNTENLDLNSLKSNLEKQKDILPSRDESIS